MLFKKLISLHICRSTTSIRSRTGKDSCPGDSDVVLFVIGLSGAVGSMSAEGLSLAHQVASGIILGQVQKLSVSVDAGYCSGAEWPHQNEVTYGYISRSSSCV